MNLALTTRWNASRHTDGEAMIEEILELGFSRVELGYDLRLDLVPGVTRMIRAGRVHVDSLHNFCPVPVGAPRGHPELYTLASADRLIRQGAVHHTSKTIRFAAEVGAKAVVVHSGYVDVPRMTDQLATLFEQGQQFSDLYEKIKLKLQINREKKTRKHLDYLCEGIEQLMPVLVEAKVKLALENLPTWEAIPTEMEMERLIARFGTDHLAAWYDLGHGQIRQNLGFINQERWLERLSPFMVGMHIHDVLPPRSDHLMPPHGQVDFKSLKRFATPALFKVIEPTPETPKEAIVDALRFLNEVWAE